jgi:hypothetical protein
MLHVGSANSVIFFGKALPARGVVAFSTNSASEICCGSKDEVRIENANWSNLFGVLDLVGLSRKRQFQARQTTP